MKSVGEPLPRDVSDAGENLLRRKDRQDRKARPQQRARVAASSTSLSTLLALDYRGQANKNAHAGAKSRQAIFS